MAKDIGPGNVLALDQENRHGQDVSCRIRIPGPKASTLVAKKDAMQGIRMGLIFDCG
jgi:hypothetical protein